MGRAPCCEKIGLKRGRWTAEEDDILIKYIQANGEGSWRSLPKNAGLLRCGKSCRLRWINYLTNNLKRGNITTQEEDIIIKLHASIGNKWSFIASQLPGRTDNEIKNYWNSHLSRKIDTFRRPINNEPLPIITVPTKKEGGRTSIATMKKKNNKIGKNVKESDIILENKSNGALVTLPLPSTPRVGKETQPSSYHDQEIVGDGMLGAIEESEEARNLLLCCPTNDQHNSSNEFLVGPHENMKSIVGGDNQDLESGILSSNGGDQSSEWDSTNSYLELDLEWEWEDQGILLNDVQDQSKHHDDDKNEEEMLSWLWDGDDQQGMEMLNNQNQEDLVAWLFS